MRRVVHYSPYFCPHRALQGHNRSATSKTRISKQLLKPESYQPVDSSSGEGTD
ncbi:MAG: hypothetical protein BECKG1743D_GA0114223_110602 [Candidatus Kentron sp. G]|nr:MAG: hypothetical protein BECKG1743D_GA0114223_110602 [Candidatus Kentron sp. G]